MACLSLARLPSRLDLVVASLDSVLMFTPPLCLTGFPCTERREREEGRDPVELDLKLLMAGNENFSES